MRVLFDQGTPVPLAQFLVGYTVSTSAREGWSRYQNSDLLNAAKAAGFEVLVTADKNLRYQQNLTVRKIAIIVLLKQQWPDLAEMCILSLPPLTQRHPGAYTEVEIP
jgi:predicted nuclease of predicted toxin-antitoxin system